MINFIKNIFKKSPPKVRKLNLYKLDAEVTFNNGEVLTKTFTGYISELTGNYYTAYYLFDEWVSKPFIVINKTLYPVCNINKIEIINKEDFFVETIL